MGGVEDDEPPSKRVKVDSMARLLESQGDDDVVGSKGVIKKVEFVRVITEALHSLGYSKAFKSLQEESGIPLHSTVVDSFMHQILDGQWDKSVSMLHEIGLIDESKIKLASFVILEQNFFDFLDGGKIMDALKTLRLRLLHFV